MKDVVTIKKSKAMLADLRRDRRTDWPSSLGAVLIWDKKRPPER
jgi:hypothetical protein